MKTASKSQLSTRLIFAGLLVSSCEDTSFIAKSPNEKLQISAAENENTAANTAEQALQSKKTAIETIPNKEIIVDGAIASTPSPVTINDYGSTSDNPCKNNPQNQKIFILDLKSGWFSGDGGDFFTQVVDSVCNGLIETKYIHLTQSNHNANIGDLSDYSQFWLLSGDENDSADLLISSPLFESIKFQTMQLKEKKPNSGFFFGAGLGNIQHANQLAKHLFPEIAGDSTNKDEGIFQGKGSTRGDLPDKEMAQRNPKHYLTSGTGTNIGTFNINSGPFGIIGSFQALTTLFDYQTCYTDPVTPAKYELSQNIIATDWCGNQATVQFQIEEHKILLEGNMARFYGFPEYFSRAALSLLQ